MVEVRANTAHAEHAAVGEEARQALREELADEYQLYHYVRQRLERQYVQCMTNQLEVKEEGGGFEEKKGEDERKSNLKYGRDRCPPESSLKESFHFPPKATCR